MRKQYRSLLRKNIMEKPHTRFLDNFVNIFLDEYFRRLLLFVVGLFNYLPDDIYHTYIYFLSGYKLTRIFVEIVTV